MQQWCSGELGSNSGEVSGELGSDAGAVSGEQGGR